MHRGVFDPQFCSSLRLLEVPHVRERAKPCDERRLKFALADDDRGRANLNAAGTKKCGAQLEAATAPLLVCRRQFAKKRFKLPFARFVVSSSLVVEEC